MTKFVYLFFNYLPKSAHFGFFYRATEEVNGASADVRKALGTLVVELNEWFAKETACVLWVRKSVLTADIVAAKGYLDYVLVGQSAQVSGARRDANPAVSAAAERLHIMRRSYGNVMKNPYLAEIGAVNAILSHLKGDLAADALTAGVAHWTAKIEAALDDFSRLIREREALSTGKPREKFTEVRRGIENVWRHVVTIVNSGAALDASPGFAALIDKLNPEIEMLNGEFYSARHNIAAAKPSPIKPQMYTGHPCTPVPEVWYITPGGETVALSLGKDFSLTFKNNVNPGNAECIIRGKGRYKGHKLITFIIANRI
jgi:hypothetical protein